MSDPEQPDKRHVSVGSAPGDEPTGEVTLESHDDDPQAVLREMMAADEAPAAAPPALDATAATARDDAALVAARAEAADWREKHLRALADLENFRKRNMKTVADLRRFGHEHAVRELLPVLDNLERALKAAGHSDDATLRQFTTGVEMIATQFRQTLERLNIVPVVTLGRPFDPQEHEAVQEIETAEVPPGHVVAEAQRGYRLFEHLLRPAKVVVARAPAAPPAADPPTADA